MGNKHIHPSCIQLNLQFHSIQITDEEPGTTEMQRLLPIKVVLRIHAMGAQQTFLSATTE